MLPRKYRLHSDYDFRRLRVRGQKYFSPLFTLIIAPVRDRQALRLGFVVSARLDKRATVRNRLKRVLREVIRRKLSQLKRGFDAAFYIRSGMLKRTYEDVAAEVDRLLPKTPLV